MQALDALEALEDPLLCWGVVDGGLTDDELMRALDSVILRAGGLETPEELAEILQQKGLILGDDSTSPPLWRTRNGETLRLLARLRQIFLSNNPQAAWRHGAQLVADYRYARRPRAYPKRDQRWDSPLTDELNDGTWREVLKLLTAQPPLQDADNFDIAGFQVRATRHILASLKAESTSGTVVGAGTGSGKTLAFYLPAFAYLAGIQDPSAWTRAVAVYPRNELLRDQFSTAFSNARKLDAVARRVNGRPLTMGVLNGDTPTTNASLKASYSAWKKSSQGYRCPTLTCPSDGGILYWPEADANSGTERLVCGSCQASFDSSVIVLTRKRMSQYPPDLLFTTTEMLNRNISNLELRHVFGIGVAKKPRLMLLDEIHTYEGTTGAQAAMTIRRWHHGVQGPVCFVGLSATLANAVRHFGDLTGVDDEFVTSIEPLPDEMEYEGAEYMIAVRSDPTSGASVLSTTIQTSMLLPRTLDTPVDRNSEGAFGTKAFVFTDDLDVTNRLFSYVLDAEGQRYYGQRAKQVKAPLAAMRMPIPGDVEQRRAGQSWDLPRDLGHQFKTTGLKVSRTTSQDAGVDVDSQLIVATASLEVGFDDPDVGAVLQHKAPRGVAAFLQRKGRAGRTRGMRPYTAVVLSDYGRDRATYEAWDALFDPVLPRLVLPIRNRAVLRMQATLATMDWLAQQVRSQKPYANLWRDLSSISSAGYGPNQRETQLAAVDLLNKVLRDPSLQYSLRQWIVGALKLPRNVVDQILWHPPRAVILAAVPALARRLATEWSVADPDRFVPGKDTLGGNPLPDFFPQNLFSELALPEGNVLVPSQRRDTTERGMQAMGMAQMLREFAPGRVSRRFATRELSHRHWIPIPTEVREAVIDIPTILPVYRHDSELLVDLDGTPTALKLIRPDQLQVELAPDEVKDSSNAVLTWSTQITETGAGLETRIPKTDPLGHLVMDVKFFLHAQNSHVEARRAAIESEASLMMEGGHERRVSVAFRLDGQRVGLGATYDVDAMSIRLELPAVIGVPEEIAPGIKSAWFRHIVTADPELLEHVNTFQLTWLFEAFEAMLLTNAVDKQWTLETAYSEVRTGFADKLQETLQAMFRSTDIDEDGDGTISRLGKRLTELLREPAVVARLDRLVEQAWKPDADAFQAWLHHRVLSTFGQAVLWAAREICPEHDPEGLFVDVEPGLEASGKPRIDEVWLTETSIGGGGFIETLAARVRPDPRRFLRLVSRALEPGTNELVDAHMHRLLSLIVSESDWSAAIAAFRSAQSQEQRVGVLGSIITKMRQAGVYGAEQAVTSSMANRLLRPGSTTATDQALHTLMNEWHQEEERLGVEIPSRTWAYLMRQRSDLDAGLNITTIKTEQHRIDAIQSLLWPRGWSLRARELESYNPYAKTLPSAPDLLRSMLKNNQAAVDVAAPEADRKTREMLADHGSAQLSARPEDSGALSDLLVGLTTRAIETNFLQVYPHITEVRHLPDGTALVSLELTEVAL
ncbi:protein DpdJ [Pseudarthrobacter sp. NPDC058119]|uniref:protein DpdJ n=1 Tax=Pseudarthrobacter sp. NPDC058119 TaxID=3346348 RepID=UPI0036D819C5